MFLAPLIFWLFSEKSPWSVQVIDKTVPHSNYREHAALHWILNNTKVSNPLDDTKWNIKRDYIGYYPDRVEKAPRFKGVELQPENLQNSNLLYIADTYGVYSGDFLEESERLTHLDYSKLIYGGLDEEEVDAIVEFSQLGGSIVAEFNTFASPTWGSASRRLQDLLGLKWSGWSGRFFSDLASEIEIPRWARRHWEEHYKEEWEFEGPGYLFAHEDTRIFVLPVGTHISATSPKLYKKTSHPLLNGVEDNITFHYWIDVVYPIDPTQILAEYRFELTEEGQRIFEDFRIPEAFPAVLLASKAPLRMYFAGDFSDNRISRGPYYLKWWPKFARWSSSMRDPHGPAVFFWKFYYPLLRNIFSLTSP